MNSLGQQKRYTQITNQASLPGYIVQHNKRIELPDLGLLSAGSQGIITAGTLSGENQDSLSHKLPAYRSGKHS